MKGISPLDFDSYIEILKSTGYSDVAQKANKVSSGIMMENDNVYLSIAYSEPGINILITEKKQLIQLLCMHRRLLLRCFLLS